MTAGDQLILKAIVNGNLTEAQREAIRGILANAKGASDEPQPLLLTQAEVARQLRCSRFTIRKLVKEGRLKPVFLTPDLARYRTEDVQLIAAGGIQWSAKRTPTACVRA